MIIKNKLPLRFSDRSKPDPVYSDEIEQKIISRIEKSREIERTSPDSGLQWGDVIIIIFIVAIILGLFALIS
jgi:hypothetical protein